MTLPLAEVPYAKVALVIPVSLGPSQRTPSSAVHRKATQPSAPEVSPTATRPLDETARTEPRRLPPGTSPRGRSWLPLQTTGSASGQVEVAKAVTPMRSVRIRQPGVVKWTNEQSRDISAETGSSNVTSSSPCQRVSRAICPSLKNVNPHTVLPSSLTDAATAPNAPCGVGSRVGWSESFHITAEKLPKFVCDPPAMYRPSDDMPRHTA